MILVAKIGVFGMMLVFVFVLFVLLDALDSMYTSRRRSNTPNTDTDIFNRKLRKFILYCMIPLGGFAMCAAGYSMIAEMLGL